jgi:hypothetical protein
MKNLCVFKASSETSSIVFSIEDNPVALLSNNASIAAVSQGLNSLTATIANQFMTGELQAKAQSLLNVSLDTFSMKPPVTNASLNATTSFIPVSKVNQIVVVTQASGCRAQSPCDVQPVLKVLDENVLLLFFYIY